MFTKNNNQGFTLVELLLYIAVTSIILLTISAFLTTLLESRVKNQTILEVESQGVQVMQLITQTLRNGANINTPLVGTNSSTLSVDTYNNTLNPTIFDISSGVIRVKEGASPVVALTNARVTASALNFENLSRADTSGTIRITFTLTYINSSGRNEYNFTKTFISSGTLRQP